MKRVVLLSLFVVFSLSATHKKNRFRFFLKILFCQCNSVSPVLPAKNPNLLVEKPKRRNSVVPVQYVKEGGNSRKPNSSLLEERKSLMCRKSSPIELPVVVEQFFLENWPAERLPKPRLVVISGNNGGRRMSHCPQPNWKKIQGQ